jgi:hypothetical protein
LVLGETVTAPVLAGIALLLVGAALTRLAFPCSPPDRSASGQGGSAAIRRVIQARQR